jgi:electron transfer flavoprotein alpha subunit
MSVLIYTDSKNGEIKKSSLEAVHYGKLVAKKLGTQAIALTINANDPSGLGIYGADKVLNIQNEALRQFDPAALAAAVTHAVSATGATVVVFAHDSTGKSIAPRVAVRLKAGLATGVTTEPDTSNGFVLGKTVFSGKANARINILSEKKVVSLMPNSFQIEKSGGSAPIENLSVDVAAVAGRIKVKEVRGGSSNGHVPLPEAELVVSAGRGLKGPENWGMVEEMANILGATTACSRPVADIGWRPHHEHVGQTGIAIRPNLYIAIGISGAIQHLAGVNQSKVIVVINKDPEAPFFKAADYGVVGDAFEVVPRLNEAFRKFKQANG